MKPDTISIKEVIGRIKEHPYLKGISDELIVDKAIQFQRIMGLAETFEEKIAKVEIKDRRGVLPEDFYEVIQVRTFSNDQQVPTYFRSMTDKFYQSDNQKQSVPYTYIIRGRVIYVSPIKTGEIEIAYRAIQMDDCGMVAIPDNEKYIRALISYIKVDKFTQLFDIGEIKADVLLNAQQEYAFNVGAAHNEFKMPTLDEMESVGNIVNSLFPRRFSHYRGYADSGSKEFTNKH